MATVRVPVKIIQQDPLIEVCLIDQRRDDGKFYLTVQQARELRIDLQKLIDIAEGRA